MSSALIIGDGPGGLGAALYLAKNEIKTTVFGQNETPMHYAMLYNYLGIPEMTGTEFQKIAQDNLSRHSRSHLLLSSYEAKSRDANLQS